MIRETIGTLPLLIAVMVMFGVMTAFFAGQKNRDQVIWGLAGAFAPLFALPALACFGHAADPEEPETEASRKAEIICKYGLLAYGCFKIYWYGAVAPISEAEDIYYFLYYLFRGRYGAPAPG